MRFAFDDEQKMLQAAVRGVLEREAPPARVREWCEARDFSAFAQLAARQGWTGIGVGEDDGGQGGGLVEQAILFEELGRACAPNGGLLAGAIATALNPATLPSVVDGERQIAVVWPADQPLDATEARPALSPLVLNAPAVDLLLALDGTVLRCDDTVGPERRLVDQTRQFADVAIPPTGGEDLTAVNARAAVLVAADSLGLARRMLDMTVAYVHDRRQFGVPVGSFQAVKHAAAQTLVEIEAAHSGVYYAAWAVEHSAPDGLVHAWIAKAYACEAAARTADTALQLHGAIGYTWEYDLHLPFKRAKANVPLLGAPGGYRERIADALSLCETKEAIHA